MGASGTEVFRYSADIERTGGKIGCKETDNVAGYICEIERI